MAESFPNLRKEMDSQIQEAHKNPKELYYNIGHTEEAKCISEIPHWQ